MIIICIPQSHFIFIIHCYCFFSNLGTRSGDEREGGIGFPVLMTGVQLTHLSAALSDDSLFSLSQAEEVHLFDPLNMNVAFILTRNSLASARLKSID